jgi:hypothetical protein
MTIACAARDRHEMTSALTRIVAILVLVATVAAGCRSSESSKSTATTTTRTIVVLTTLTTSTTTGAPPPSTTAATSTTAAPPTTVTAATTTTLPSSEGVSAADVLATIPVAPEHPDGYNRDLFKIWTDDDHNGCDTRAEVLLRDATSPPNKGPRCTLTGGTWISPYDNKTVTSPAGIQIDHVVALKEAWDSGVWAWTPAERQQFANDLTDVRTLRAVSSSSNESKGDADPSNWLPPNTADVCPYIGDWIAIKARWQLTMDQSEAGRLRNLLIGQCAGLRISPWQPVTITTTPATTAPPVPTAAPAPTSPASIAAPPGSDDSVYYPNCAAAKAAGAAPLHRGDPGYRTGLDRDGDGIACEN